MQQKYKTTGQIFSPKWLVEKMLDLSAFNTQAILKLKVIDPCCGTGAFLEVIVERIIKQARLNQINDQSLVEILQTNVYGIEIDPIAFQTCWENLNAIATNHNLPPIQWKLFNANTLITYHKYCKQFDLVISNPPYVRIHNTSENLKQFRFCQSGMSDLYIAFYEIGLQLLNPTGKLCYINPSSMFSAKATQLLRNYLWTKRLINTIIDFQHLQLFPKINTYVAIILLIPNQKAINYANGFDEKWIQLNYRDVQINQQWYFHFPNQLKYLKQVLNHPCKMIVKNGIATLNDRFFIDPFWQTIKSPYVVDVVKAATLKSYKIFFPYQNDFQVAPFNAFNQAIQKFLMTHQNQLINRSLSDPTKWWAYGRNQAISDLKQIKVTINLVIKNQASIKTTIVTNGLVYSGLYVVAKSLAHAKAIQTLISSQLLIDYVKLLGKYKSGGYWSFNSKQLNHFISFHLDATKV